MHLKRVIPCLDVDAGRVVKGTNFVDLRDAGDPVELAAKYDAEGADEVVFLDITATSGKRDTIVDLARRTADDVFVPFTIGGGIRSVADAQGVLDAGADKVSVNSAAVARPELLDELADVFGVQCVVLAIDAKAKAGGGWEVFVAGGRTPTGRDVLEWAREGVRRGAGEILLTSMDRDGTEHGYDLGLTSAVAAPSTSRSSPRAAPGTSSTSPTPCAPVRTLRWRHRSSTTASSPSARRSATSRTPASPSACVGQALASCRRRTRRGLRTNTTTAPDPGHAIRRSSRRSRREARPRGRPRPGRSPSPLLPPVVVDARGVEREEGSSR